MPVVSALLSAAEHTVDIAGISWKLRRVRSRDLAVAGHGQLLALLTADDLAGVVDDARNGRALNLAAVSAALTERLRSMPDTARVRMANAQDSMACAGVVAVRPANDPEAPWERVRLVADKDSDAAAGVVNVADLPDGVRRALADAVHAHSSDEEGLASALASFRASRAPND